MYQMTLLVRAGALKKKSWQTCESGFFYRLLLDSEHVLSPVHHVHRPTIQIRELLIHTVNLQFSAGKSPLLELRDKAFEVSPVGERKQK